MAGNERLAYEIAAIYSGSPEIKKAFDDFAKLNAQGQKVVNQLDRMGQQAKKTGEEIRNSRSGAAQLGMQFNQLGTQVVSGTNVFTAFAQQIGDVGYAMTMMGGRTAAVGNFLAGPWGAAIGIAAVALGPLISNLMGVTEETKNAESAAKDMDSAIAARKGSEEDLRLALAKTATEYYNIRKEMQANALVAVRTATVELQARAAVLGGLMKEQKALEQKISGAGGLRGQAEMASGTLVQQYGVVSKTADAITAVNAQVTVLEGLTAKLNASTINVVSAGERVAREAARSARRRAKDNKDEADTIEEIDRKYQSLLDKKMKAFREEGKPIFVRNLPTTLDQTIVQPSIDVLNQVSEYINSTYGQQVAMAIKGPNEEMIKSFESIGASVDNAFKGMLTAGMSWKDGMKGIINSVINELWRLYVTQQIVGMVSNAIGGLFRGGGIGGNTGGLEANFDKVFSGRAIGGSVSANTPYIVGERGPELFVPGGNGTIIPNKNMSNGGGAPNINVTVDARGSADPAAVREQVQRGILEAAPAIVAAAQQRTISTLRRPKLGGAMQ